MLTNDKIDALTGFNYEESIASMRQYAPGGSGFAQFTDDQIQFIMRERNYYLNAKMVGEADANAGDDSWYGWSWGDLEISDLAPMAAQITAHGLKVDEATLKALLEAEMPYLVEKKWITSNDPLFVAES